MKRLTRAIEKRITEDWRQEFPSLGVYKPRHLLRRVGPLLVGICLDRDSGGEKYKPTFHVHALCIEFPCVSLTLAEQLRSERSGGPDFIEVRWHAEQYKEAAARMKKQSPLAMEGDLSLAEVVAAYRDYMESPIGMRQAAILYQGLALLAACVRSIDLATKFLAEATSVLGDDPHKYCHVGGKEAFVSRCKTAIADPSVLDAMVDNQIRELGVEALPLSSLTI